MKYLPPARLFVFLALFLWLADTTANAQPRWTRAQSANFELVGNSSEREIRRVATTLEQFREVFVRLFPTLKYDSPVPTRVIIFRNERAFRPYKPRTSDGKPTDWVSGYFRSSEDANFIVLTTERERQQTFQLIYHEYIHYIINNSFGRAKIPPWFNEGLAEYYDQFAIEGDIKVALGRANENHILTLRNSRLIPLEEFFKIDYYTLHRQGKHGANIFYAQAWAMMHYLLNGRQETRAAEIDKFLQGVRQGRSHETAFRDAFQMDFAEMERELRNYVNRDAFNVVNLTFKEKLTFDDKMTTEPVAEHYAKAVLGDLLLAERRFDDAEAHLLESLEGDPDSPYANASMGMVMMHRRDFPQARKFFEKALAHKSENHLVYFRYAYMLSREAMDPSGWVSNYSPETAEKMRKSLEKAISLNPRFPESYKLYAFVSLVRNENIDEGLERIRRAIALSPGNEYYQLDLAGLLIRKEEFDQARRIAESILKAAFDPEVKNNAENVLRNLEMFERNREAIRAMREANSQRDRPPVILDADEPPLSEEKLKELREIADLQSINRVIRPLQDGEIRVLADLKDITCGKDNSIVYTIVADTGELRLSGKDFHDLHLVTFIPAKELEVGCGTIREPLRALLTYVPGNDPQKKTVGVLIAIELVPEYFRFLPEDEL